MQVWWNRGRAVHDRRHFAGDAHICRRMKIFISFGSFIVYLKLRIDQLHQHQWQSFLAMRNA